MTSFVVLASDSLNVILASCIDVSPIPPPKAIKLKIIAINIFLKLVFLFTTKLNNTSEKATPIDKRPINITNIP